MKLIIGNIDKQQQNSRGWLVGQFMNEPFKDNNIEIYYKTFLKGPSLDKLHRHPIGYEYLIVLEGKANFKIGDDILLIKKGDYLKIPSNIPDQLLEIIEDLIIMGIRTPSIPNNKILILE